MSSLHLHNLCVQGMGHRKITKPSLSRRKGNLLVVVSIWTLRFLFQSNGCMDNSMRSYII